jgi:peptidylprolyl isomerase
MIEVHYKGALKDGTVFDSSDAAGEPFKFLVGLGHVVKGWDMGVMTMKQGEKAEVIMTPEYGYGKWGSPPKIPEEATLVFTVEVIDFHERRLTRWMMQDSEKIKATLRLKEDATIKFKSQDWLHAEADYREALSHIDIVENDNEKIKELRKILNQNISLCCNKQANWLQSIQCATKSLLFDPFNAKALFYRAIANKSIMEFDAAVFDIKEAIKLLPADKNLRTEYENIKKDRKLKESGTVNAFRDMLSQGMYNEKDGAITRFVDTLPDYSS